MTQNINMNIEQRDYVCGTQLEVSVGSDSIIRINVDGICCTRIRMRPGSQLAIVAPGGDTVLTNTYPPASDPL